MSDPVKTFVHDHADLHRRILALAAERRTLEGTANARSLHGALVELRDALFLHFAREEEGLFPFVAESVPALSRGVDELATAHDTICGALSRMVQLTAADCSLASLAPLFERFEGAYADHGKREAAVLAQVDDHLTDAQRAQLARLLDGL